MSNVFQDCFQWMSVTEETLFLHDGLIRVTDLVELPRDVNNTQGGDNEVISFDLKSPKDLSDRLLAVCGTQNNAYARLLEYRLNALRGYWTAQRQFVGDGQQDQDSSANDETLTILKKQGFLKEPEQAPFSTRISVLLVLPLLQSQSRIDPNLCGVTAKLLLDCLRDCAPLSLAKEPGDCLSGLENLLCSWLGEEKDKDAVVTVTDLQQRTSAAAALIALACARGHLKTFIHTVHLLQSLTDLASLPVSDIVSRLLETDGGQGPSPGLSGNKHVLCWGLEDMLGSPEKESKDKDKNKEAESGRSIACDGLYLYTTNTQGKGISKIGTGLHGTLRGYIYNRNLEVNAGRLAYGSGCLLCRPQSFDLEPDMNNLCLVLHPDTLQILKAIPKPDDYARDGPQTTVGFCSDGTYFYWIWLPGSASDKTGKGVPVYLDKFTFDSDQLLAVQQQPRVILQKKDESAAKALSESLLAKLRPFRGSASSITLAALTGLDPLNTRKDDGLLAGSTTCGISLKSLLKTPVTCDGSHVLFLTSIAGGATNSSASRGFFGGPPGITGLRTLGSCMCFAVKNGHYGMKTDLSDAPTCSLGRGSAVSAVGLCFDKMNNSIWMCSSDWVDQFYNQAHQAQHHIHNRLKVNQGGQSSEDRELVIKDLLQHVGSMCLHQINNDLLHTSILQQQTADLVHVGRIVDILNRSLEVKDNQIVMCSLIVLQLTFKVNVFKRRSEEEESLLKRLSDLVWNLLKSRDKMEKPSDQANSIITEACHVITNGLPVLYYTDDAKNRLMMSLLDSNYPAYVELRDMILIDFSDRLRGLAYTNSESKYLCFNDETVSLILKLAVKESCDLIKHSVTSGKDKFDELQARVPVASSCLRYMMSLQSFLLREAILYRSKAEEPTEQNDRIIIDLQVSVMNLASKVFKGSYQVLEILLDTCNTVIVKHKEDLECWLQGLERLAKATVLGHLLPVMLTSLTHHNLRCLQLGDSLMSQLVHLVVLTSQTALLLKSQVQAVHQEVFDKDTDIDVAELIGQAVHLENDLKEKEEEGFLAGLRIPAPWSSGKSIESIHPVRDNYKLKETVHIPGARCLYLRFDPRCASQYDYDKLVLYAGPTTNSKKVAEYGGNTYGFGSRSVLGSGWPKDLVKVDGDTVTFSFEMRSGREHNTPDKAMWGFLCTVRAQESTEEVSHGLPFLADLALGLSVLACTMLQLLYQGPEKSKQESSCRNLLMSKLLQRCVWQTESGRPVPGFSPDSTEDMSILDEISLPRIKLPIDIVQNLRRLCQRQPQTLRPSIREVIQPDVLEERILSTVIKHLSLVDVVQHLPTAEHQKPEEYSLLQSVLQETYKRLDALIRQLQSLADHEQRWHQEVLDHRQENILESPPYFHDYHLQETRCKEVLMLCFVKDIQPDQADIEKSVKALREKFNAEVQSPEVSETCLMTFTSHLVKGVLSRLDLLLQVNIEPHDGICYSRNMSIDPTQTGVMVRSDTDILKHSYSLSRSMSAPNGVDLSMDEVKHKRLQKHKRGPVHILQDLLEQEEMDQPPHVILIEQLFSFIGSNPENAVSSRDFLSAAQTRWRRGHTRKQALVHMKELLTAAARVGGTTHLVAAVTSVLQRGPCVDELTCGGMVSHVREAFSETMTSLVQLAARYPIACCNSIGLMCIIPYTRAEEKCLVRSGLVHLLDKLCSLANYRLDSSNTEAQSTHQKVSAMAWAGFQVLANRCVMWETEDGNQFEQLEHSGLARQVSVLLTNHLARATKCSGNEAAGSEALQDVLSLLNNLSRSKMGKAILSQPACVSKLLSLLLDQRPSPKLVLIILQLCRVALPLMSTDDCEYLELPSWGQHLHNSHWSNAESISDPPAKIVSLLLAKLGDFLVPGDYSTICSRRPSADPNSSEHGSNRGDKDKNEDCDIQGGRLSVFVHKRTDQMSQEIIQSILSSDSRQSRLGSLLTEKAVRMDRELNKTGKAEVVTEDAVTAIKKAAKWAQSGLVISTGPPVDMTPPEATNGDKKKLNSVTVCREKNNDLARTDPVRPFISGHVANSMAGEVIALLHGLLTAPESHTAHSWADAVQRVLNNALSCLPLLLTSIESLSSPRCNSKQLLFMAKLGNAALCSLGGFKEIIKPGCDVRVTGSGIHNTKGTVVSVSEQTGQVTVQMASDQDLSPRFSDIIQVPITRLEPIRNKMYKSHHLPSTEAVVMAIKSILLPQDDNLSTLQKTFPLTGDGNSINNITCRVVSELQTRACMVLASYLNDVSFSKEFIQHCGSTIDVLKCLAKECNTGDRLAVIEDHCTRLRLLYRDCAKPPPPPSKVDNRMSREMLWDPNRVFPPVKTCVFSHGVTGVTFLGDPNTGSGFPRGTMIYANQPLPQQAPSFYWELEILSFGDSQDESSAVISFGFAPLADKKDGAWTNPVGTCLFLNNGKSVHYNGASLLQWRSVRLDVTFNAGDIAGIGWERTGDSTAQGQIPKGRVYFTYRGRLLSAYMEDVSGGLFPVVHIQKKGTRVRANFGTRPFAYAKGQQHRDAADEANDLTREIRESFGHLPFHQASESEDEEPVAASPDIPQQEDSPQGPPCKLPETPKPQKEYDPDLCKQYKLFSSYDNFLTTGPDYMSSATQEDESDEEPVEDETQSEDHYALLVKAWEQKVFPVIRRRFRNEAERKDGLEQIKGALQLGMTDIARQTVEFLYEENGGIPRDLHLPTTEDIKEDLAKFTIERVRKGTVVVIRNTTETSTSGTTMLPMFAVRSMLRTFGLTGTVLDVDTSNELVQVETYLRSEGVLVRFWYPIDMLERPGQGLRKSSITGGQILDTSNTHIHRELLRCEGILSRMYCRTALLKLIDHCNSPAMEIYSCSASLGSGMAASAALLQQLDIENLQLLSEELLCPPQPHGTIQNASLVTSSSLEQCLAISSCSLTKLLYCDEDKLKRELAVAIARAANQGEDYLIELTNQICICLQTAPEMFPYEEFPVTEVKVNTDVHFPGASCLVVSCKTDPKVAKKDTSLYKSPWAKVLSYNGSRVRKSGQPTKLECVSYPRDTSSTSNQNEQYTPAIIPCDRVHVKLGVSPPPGIMLTIHAMYPQFLLAVAYIETLIVDGYGCGTMSCGTRDHTSTNLLSKDLYQSLWNVDNIKITPAVFKHVIELLCCYLWKCSIPSLIKEYMFQLLAQSLRILNYSEGCCGSVLPTLQPHLNPNTGLLVQLQMELKRLYEEETKGLESISTASGVGIGIGVSDKGRFSTYFHSLLEVVLSTAEIKYDEKSKTFFGLTSVSFFDSSSSGSLHSVGSPTSSTKKKKIKAKRDKERGGAVPKRTPTSSPRVSESDSLHSASSQSFTSLPSTDTSATSLSSSSSLTSESSKTSGTKPEDILWFQKTLTVSQIVRSLAFQEKHAESSLNTAVLGAAQVLQMPSVYNRLLVITGIPDKQENVRSAIYKACQSSGGLDRDDIFLPVHSTSLKVRVVDRPETHQMAETSGATVETGAVLPIKRAIKGTVIINIASKSKLENIKKSLLKNLSFHHDEHADVPEEMLMISTVNGMLVTTEPQANEAVEEYLHSKFFSVNNPKEISDAGTLALIEVFHSCFIMDQRHGSEDSRQDSGFICLSKEQILQHVEENLLFCFFNNIRPPKKSLPEQVTHVLKKYGMLKSPDKEMSPNDNNGKGKGPKKSPKSSKEKVVLGVSEKPTNRDRKPKSKDIPEKSQKDSSDLSKGGKSWPVEESRHLTLEGFLQYVIDMARQDIRSVWRALLACGFDFFFERCACLDNNQAQQMSSQWTLEMDSALVQYVNNFTKKLGVAPSRLHPHEIRLPEEILTNEAYTCLQGVPVESVRLRFAFLQSLNNSLETMFLPMVDLRPAKTFNRSTANALSKIRGLLFYNSKINFVNRIMNATAKRKPDQAAPEVTLDPLENLSENEKSSSATWYCQTFRQLSNIPSKQLCVRLACGGDPTYSFNVRLTGEEVHGTSGSFRQFLSQIAKELLSLKLIVPCNNSSYKSRCLLHPGKMTFPEERLTEFFGQILGITIRADIPLGLDLLKSLWQSIVGMTEDPVTNLQEADPLTYSYIKKIEMVETESELQALCSDVYPQFVYTTLSGEEVELIPNGQKVSVCWENRQEYIEAIQRLRMRELLPEHRIQSLHCGLALLIPLQLLHILSPLDLEIRTCGLPEVDLDFLKTHTMYQVGLMESDKHIEFFWNALNGLGQDELCKFIKFACNQERIPQSCPCKEGGADTTHVPPYPMKIAPPDGPGPPDSRFIRVETCMFMVKLPQYSSQELMTQRLLYAINCREDPLSG